MDLVGPAGIIAEAVDHQRQIGGAALADRLAVIQRFELGELVEMRLDQVGELVHEPSPVAGIHRAPRSGFKRLARGLDREIDIGRIPFGHLGDHLLRSRVDCFKRLATLAVAPLAIDQHLGLVRGSDLAVRFGCRGHQLFSLIKNERSSPGSTPFLEPLASS